MKNLLEVELTRPTLRLLRLAPISRRRKSHITWPSAWARREMPSSSRRSWIGWFNSPQPHRGGDRRGDQDRGADEGHQLERLGESLAGRGQQRGAERVRQLLCRRQR